MRQVLVIEDEKNLSRFIEMELQHEGMEVAVAHDGRQGLEMALGKEWDVILLDIMLPGLNGIEVCRRIRNVKATPIIMLTARDSIIDKVSGLDSGADDYIPKPFAVEELLARLRVIFRRSMQQEDKEILTFKDIVVDQVSQIVRCNGETIDLTKREYDLLLFFMRNINRVLTRDIILDQVWGYNTVVETNVVDVYVRYLRTKLQEGEDEYIRTIRGTGYVMR
ncbi:response regulator transcription factor [Paenibacillus sp. sptzw28]|uniref:response regulator transcription factor n=1 Tax=Paenibacillus sp. sptzw28 TaxID=715179 RepID=UPI001C6F1E77|nr:response regulator transcription factor [Paenibacillus sp. sptzw28]QYR19346.1 response regulator transcription factor [Paenibacillus sp. sptzw28]